MAASRIEHVYRVAIVSLPGDFFRNLSARRYTVHGIYPSVSRADKALDRLLDSDPASHFAAVVCSLALGTMVIVTAQRPAVEFAACVWADLAADYNGLQAAVWGAPLQE